MNGHENNTVVAGNSAQNVRLLRSYGFGEKLLARVLKRARSNKAKPRVESRFSSVNSSKQSQSRRCDRELRTVDPQEVAKNVTVLSVGKAQSHVSRYVENLRRTVARFTAEQLRSGTENGKADDCLQAQIHAQKAVNAVIRSGRKRCKDARGTSVFAYRARQGKKLSDARKKFAKTKEAIKRWVANGSKGPCPGEVPHSPVRELTRKQVKTVNRLYPEPPSRKAVSPTVKSPGRQRAITEDAYSSLCGDTAVTRSEQNLLRRILKESIDAMELRVGRVDKSLGDSEFSSLMYRLKLEGRDLGDVSEAQEKFEQLHHIHREMVSLENRLADLEAEVDGDSASVSMSRSRYLWLEHGLLRRCVYLNELDTSLLSRDSQQRLSSRIDEMEYQFDQLKESVYEKVSDYVEFQMSRLESLFDGGKLPDIAKDYDSFLCDHGAAFSLGREMYQRIVEPEGVEARFDALKRKCEVRESIIKKGMGKRIGFVLGNVFRRFSESSNRQDAVCDDVVPVDEDDSAEAGGVSRALLRSVGRLLESTTPVCLDRVKLRYRSYDNFLLAAVRKGRSLEEAREMKSALKKALGDDSRLLYEGKVQKLKVRDRNMKASNSLKIERTKVIASVKKLNVVLKRLRGSFKSSERALNKLTGKLTSDQARHKKGKLAYIARLKAKIAGTEKLLAQKEEQKSGIEVQLKRLGLVSFRSNGRLASTFRHRNR